MIYVANAFSLNMINHSGTIGVFNMLKVPAEGIIHDEDTKSIVGHKQIADILGVECNRESVTLVEGDAVIVAQYRGPRLEEGATELPEDATIEYKLVCIHERSSIDLVGEIISETWGYSKEHWGFGYNSDRIITRFKGVFIDQLTIGE